MSTKCANDLSKIKALTIKIALESNYSNSKNIYYYVKSLSSEPAGSTASFINSKKDALLVLRLFERYKELCFDAPKPHPQISKILKAKDKIIFEARYNGFYHSRLTLRLVEDEKKKEKYLNRAKSSSRIFTDSYLMFLLKLILKEELENPVHTLFAIIFKATIRAELQQVISRLNGIDSFTAIKFRCNFSQKKATEPLIVMVPLLNFFFSTIVYNRFDRVIPKFPAMCIRADGLETAVCQSCVEDNCTSP
eukprot:TRINITY_DN3052_c0_g1_i8.p1 TRINITY_DN3052_c0_g1~~TRINITY_DN3052_c0_g1_i8.p1  ORF type:complete len:250 (+),score=44.93 TRINITY_DN3052_c0_g1_i8:339-1088(+)